MTTEKDILTLVPPYLMCKQIPEGAFAESALVYWIFQRGVMVQSRRIPMAMSGRRCVPAPTLMEIMSAIRAAGGFWPTCSLYANEWCVGCYKDDPKQYDVDNHVRAGDPDNPATAALQVWFKIKELKKNEG